MSPSHLPRLMAVAVVVALTTNWALAQSRSSTTVNGVTIAVESEGSASVSTIDGEAVIDLDGTQISVGPGRIEAGGATVETDPFTEVLVSSAGGTLRIVADGQEVMSIASSGGGSLADRAAAGDPAAQNDLAIERFGQGDAAEGERLLRTAAEAGLDVAQSNLGHRLWFGDGLAQNREEGLRWIEAASSQGYPPAMILHAQILINGDGVPSDPERGLRSAELAAATGSPPALNYLGYLYGTGTAVPLDAPRAAGLYLQAAQAGDQSAMLNLGFLHRDSAGEAPAREVALEWVGRAAEAGQPGAAELLAEIEAMSAAREASAGGPPALPWEGKEYFWADAGAAVGPLSFQELRALVAEGRIGPETLVWESGTPDWVRAADLAVLDTVLP